MTRSLRRTLAALAACAVALAPRAAAQDAAAPGRRITAGPDSRVALDFQHFYTVRELEDALKALAAAYPEFVRLESMGTSRDGRELWVVTLSALDGADPSARPALFVAAGMDASEAQGTEMALSTLVEFLQNHARDPAVGEVLSRVAIYVAPCLDPDARARLLESADAAASPGAPARGATALEANFPIGWDPWELGARGGPYPLCEPESRALAQFLLAHDNVAVLEVLSNAPLRTGAASASVASGDAERYREVSERVRASLRDAGHFGAYPDLSRSPGSVLEFAYVELGAFAFATDVAIASNASGTASGLEAALELPSVSELPQLGRRAWQATFGLARSLARFELRVPEVQRLKNDLWQIDVRIANVGDLPSLSAAGVERVACATPRLATSGGKVVAAALRAQSAGGGYEVVNRSLQDLALRQVGGGAEIAVRLVVQAAPESVLEFVLSSRRGGGARASVTLR